MSKKIDINNIKFNNALLDFDITWIVAPILKIRSRSFTLGEIIHRHKNITIGDILIGMYRLGYMQGLSDYLYGYYGRHIRIQITSGLRHLLYNRSIGSSDGSFHIWRFDNLWRIISANDIKSPDISTQELSDRVSEFVRGETYEHKKWGFVHLGDYGVDEDWDQW